MDKSKVRGYRSDQLPYIQVPNVTKLALISFNQVHFTCLDSSGTPTLWSHLLRFWKTANNVNAETNNMRNFNPFGIQNQ